MLISECFVIAVESVVGKYMSLLVVLGLSAENDSDVVVAMLDSYHSIGKYIYTSLFYLI